MKSSGKKPTTYQRLKADNLRLRRELFKVCAEPHSIEAVSIVISYKMQAELEKAIWFGEVVI
jgi:hypothetical protein